MTDAERIKELEAAIRKHRDQRGDDRCWIDDLDLYRNLEDTRPGELDITLPPKCEFLQSCERYWTQRQHVRNESPALTGMTIAQLEAEADRLRRDWQTFLGRFVVDRGEGAGAYRWAFDGPPKAPQLLWNVIAAPTFEAAVEKFRTSWLTPESPEPPEK